MSQTTTRIRTQEGRFSSTRKLFSGNGNGSTVQVGEQDLQAFLRAQRKEQFRRAVGTGAGLLFSAMKAVREGDFRAALAAATRDRYACAAYLADQASRRCRRFIPVSAGFEELAQLEALWKEKDAAKAPSAAEGGNGKTPSPPVP